MIKLLLLALTLEGGAALWLAHRASQRQAAEDRQARQRQAAENAWATPPATLARLARLRVPVRPYQQAS